METEKNGLLVLLREKEWEMRFFMFFCLFLRKPLGSVHEKMPVIYLSEIFFKFQVLSLLLFELGPHQI